MTNQECMDAVGKAVLVEIDGQQVQVTAVRFQGPKFLVYRTEDGQVGRAPCADVTLA